MKTIKYILASLAIVLVAASCVKDLNVTPIDPNKNTADKALVSEQDFEAFLAGIYTGYATSGYYGPNGDPSIKGLDGGMSQYIRGLFHLCELPTDVYVCGWNDEGVPDVCKMQWDASTGLIYSIYSRMFFQISQCNEFIRQAQQTNLAFASKDQMIAEARALRALSYYHAIDIFGNVPFSTETSTVGAVGPDQISRADLFKWIDDECADLIAGGELKGAKQNVYGRLDVNFVKMVRAHLNLNAAVYLGISASEAKPYYDVVGTLCKEIKNDYQALHAKYTDLFGADNDKMTDEMIFCIPQDGTNIQNYGGTNFIIKSSCKGGDKATAAALGIDDGWGGTLVTPEFIAKFDDADARKLFWGVGGDMSASQAIDVLEFDYGWSAHKFSNVNSDGTTPSVINFMSTDVPLFRAADAYLMLAEAQLRGASTVSESEGKEAWNAVRERAGLGECTYSLDELLDERGRELYWESWRRSDLVRFDKLTSGDYLWTWKGGVQEGTSVDSHYNLMPIPTSELNSNSKLSQNAGYVANK